MTDNQRVQSTAARLGFTARKKDGKWRICPQRHGEETAYYTTDVEDAIGTMTNWDANSMTRRHLIAEREQHIRNVEDARNLMAVLYTLMQASWWHERQSRLPLHWTAAEALPLLQAATKRLEELAAIEASSEM